jgi:5-methyltetrahydrofolate--homocysteine methyltransferase
MSPSPSRFEAALRTQPLLFDGGLGTALIAAGLDLKQEPPEAWLRSHPETVKAIHTAFATAGADILQTNTFGLLRLLRAHHPLCATLSHARHLAQRSVELAANSHSPRPGCEPWGPPSRRSFSGRGVPEKDLWSAPWQEPAVGPWVVASLGPSGLTPTRPEAEALRDWVTALSIASAESGAHALHLETACDASELAALLEGAWAGPLPLLVSITVSLGQSGMETPLGVPLPRMLRTIDDGPGMPLAVGINCSLPARRMRRAVGEIAQWAAGRRCKSPRVLVQPQVDEPAPDCKRPPIPESPERFASDLLRLREDGAELLGGCCGARPEHIAAVRAGLG